jgi:hypothetical protein
VPAPATPAKKSGPSKLFTLLASPPQSLQAPGDVVDGEDETPVALTVEAASVGEESTSTGEASTSATALLDTPRSGRPSKRATKTK